MFLRRALRPAARDPLERWDEGENLLDLFTKIRAIHLRIIEERQDDAAPNFGRTQN